MAAKKAKMMAIKSSSDFRLKLWETRDQFGDVILICGKSEEKIKAHKIILAAASKFFAEILQTIKEIKLSDVDATDLEQLLKFVYTGQVTIFECNLEKFILIAQKFKIEGAPRIIRQLMPEILIKIFGYLPAYDVLKSVALVSKQFSELTKYFKVPLDFEIGTRNPISINCINGMLTRRHQIQKLKLKPFKIATAAITLAISSLKLMKNLKVLEVDYLNPSDSKELSKHLNFSL